LLFLTFNFDSQLRRKVAGSRRHQAGAEISDLVAPNRPLKTHIALKCGPPLHDDAQMDDGTQMEPDGDPLAQILGQFVRNPLQRLVCL
jgi:hypothetical protein